MALLTAHPLSDAIVDVGDLVAVRDALSRMDAELLTGTQAKALTEELARLSKAALAAAGRAAARAAACRAHQSSGAADATDWLASTLGSTRGAARKAMETAERLGEGCAATAAALAAGEVSTEEADEIARTAAQVPGAEAELLARARRDGLAGVREEGRRRRAAAIDDADLARRQRRARSVRSFPGELGMVELRASLLPAEGTALINRFDAEADRLRRAARARGEEVEEHHAYVHDAFVALFSEHAGGGAPRRPRKAEVVFVCDLNAVRRGHAHPGEACHVVGGGRVPVATVLDALDDAFVKLVTHDGVKIDTVLHLSRYRRAELETALALGSPPAFAGLECSEAGCTRRHHLEIDHIDPVANGGPTTYDNLTARCWPHHAAKTERDRQAGLLDGRARRSQAIERLDDPDDRGPP